MGENNVKEGDANNSSGVYYIIHQALIRTHIITWTYIGICWVLLDDKLYAAVQSDHGWDRWIRGSYTDGRGPASQFIVWPTVRMYHTSSAHIWW